MAPRLQTFPVSSLGGLDLVTPPHLLAQKVGSAVRLQNYEALTEGGYQRISGYSALPALPVNPDPIRGVYLYDDRPVVTKGSSVYHLQTNNTWLEVTATLAGSARTQMVTPIPADKEVLFITDAKAGAPKVVTETSPGVYSTVECTPTVDLVGAQFCAVYQDHVVVSGITGKPGEVAVSTRFDPTTFNGTGSWRFQVQDEVTGLAVFRDLLYVFCRESIYRVKNLDNSTNATVEPVTTKVGCVDGFTIQEVAGDILFLANDGLRYLGATERIGDISFNLQTELIEPLLEKLSRFQGNISSCVISQKRQYRLFYYDSSGVRKGIIGVLQDDNSFSWTTTQDMEVEHIYAGTVNEKAEVYHCSEHEVFNHQSGSTFNGVEFDAAYTSPYIHLGDAQVRKRFHSITVYLEAVETAAIDIHVRYDYENTNTMQPAPFPLTPVVNAARYGTAVYGAAQYGAIRFPLENIFLEGSGKWVQFEFRDSVNHSNSSYVIRGYDLVFTSGGRI